MLPASWSKSLETSFIFVFRRRLQDVLIKKNIFVLVIRLQDMLKTFSRRLPSRHLQDVFKTTCQNVFKTSSRHLAKMSSRHLQNVFKRFWRRHQDFFRTYNKVKLFLLTRSQDVFETYSKRFWGVLQRRLSTEGFVLVTLPFSVQYLQEWQKFLKF